ncbi:hypothetical protein NQ317_001376 [Molorchus minor]|uniref:C2H2-type domain-containing protein n=1 Tax=Molorchus minor TaxID=1323400 RepID=A0ABQ9J8L1_9CUCU|nr:hypothetical protein NQ317_001376 [Molorchus minor]
MIQDFLIYFVHKEFLEFFINISKEVYHTIMDSVACASCVGLLTSYVNFATICEGTEEKINLYREMQQNVAVIKLSKTIAFLDGCIQYSSVSIKKEGLLDSFKESDCKEEVEVQLFKCETCEFQTKRKDFFNQHLLLHKDISDARLFKGEACESQTKHKSLP